MVQQVINPPYDGSEPCPVCQIRGEAGYFLAYLHNFLTRCDVKAGRIEYGKAMVKLNDMRRCTIPAELPMPHPIIQEVVDVARALVEACEGMTDEGLTIRWTPEVKARVEALIPRAAAAMDAMRPLEEAHNADNRHSRGEPNVMRESRGSSWAGFVNPDYEAARYDYTLTETFGGSHDLRHQVCGAALVIHEHFKANLRSDPTFYGKVWCPRCRIEAPSAQFECVATA